MDKQIIFSLKQKLQDLSAAGLADAEALRNAAKEELQFYVLNFIYHHPKYGAWIMYGGSALRICHGLNRMSVDLDFEISEICSEEFLNNLKREVELYFLNNYGLEADKLSVKINNGRGLLLRFEIGEELEIKHPSKQVHVKIDLNNFTAPKTVIQRIPINRGQFSLVIKTYNMSSLMASKIAAILSRGRRGVGEAEYAEKGRDIYDLLWYMEKKIVPDLDYLSAKGIDIKNLRALFDRLTLQMNEVSLENLHRDLTPLFLDQSFIKNWLDNWHESYLRLLESYNIRTIIDLWEIYIRQDFQTDNYFFTYIYNTEERKPVKIIYAISDYWLDRADGDIPTKINDEIIKLVVGEINNRLNDKLKQYTMLFYEKNEAYFKKTNNIILGDIIQTKIIRMTAPNLNQENEIVLNRSALLSCELEDFLK